MAASTLNNTLEEELRIMLVEKNNECNNLKNQIEILEKTVADEQEQKYRAPKPQNPIHKKKYV